MEEFPDFAERENNCQKFVKYLLNALIPNGYKPEIITAVLDRLLQIDQVPDSNPFTSSSRRLQIPGASSQGGMMPTLTSPRTAFFQSLPASMEVPVYGKFHPTLPLTTLESSTAWDEELDFHRSDELSGLTSELRDMEVR
jgi:hypothetical protein